MRRAHSSQKGFTIVELLIVIVVIAILAVITIVAYTGIANRAKASSAQSAVESAVKKIASYAVLNSDQYPATLADAGVNDSGNTSFQYSVNNSANPATYCVTATVVDVSYFASNTQTNPTSGGCPGHGQGGVASVTNLVTNPSFEVGGGLTEVRRNFYMNPVNGGTQTAGLAQGLTAYTAGAGTTAPTFAVSSGWQQITATNLPASVSARAGYRITVPFGQTVVSGTKVGVSASIDKGTLPAGVQAKLYVDAYDGSGNFRGNFNQAVIPNAGSSTRINGSITLTGDATYLSWYVWLEPTNNAAGWTGTATVGFSWSMAEIGGPTSPAFYGGGMVTPDSDFTPSWTGAANASASILQAPSPTGTQGNVNDSAVVSSSAWNDTGTKSLRIVPKSSSNASYGDIPNVLAVGKTYTIIAKVHLTGAQTGTLNTDARKLLIRQVGSATAYQYLGAAAPNAAGDYELRGTATVSSDTTTPLIRILNGASAGNGDIWVDSVMAVEVPDVAHPYTGPARYGDSPNWIWNGTTNASTSTGPGN